MIRRLLIALLFLAGTSLPAYAQRTCYVREGGTATGSAGCFAAGGSPDWSDNSKVYDDFSGVEAAINRATNGEYTVYVADGNYTGGVWNASASGTNWVRIEKATAAEHGTATGWLSGYGDGVATINGRLLIDTSYWEIDGHGTNFTNWGFKMEVPADTSLDTQTVAINIRNGGTNNITVQHVWINIADPGTGVWNNGIGPQSGGGHHYTYRNIRVTGAGEDAFKIKGHSNLLEYLWVDGRNAGAGSHGDAVAGTNTYGSGGESSTIRYSIFDWQGAIFWFDGTAPGIHGPWYIYGNVLFGNQLGGEKGFDTSSGVTSLTLYGYHNTLYNLNVTSSAGITAGEFKNNIYYLAGSSTGGGFAGASHDYNAFSPDLSTGGEPNAQVLATDPFNDAPGDLTLSTATNCGVPLATTFEEDILGNTRGQDGCWDRGAYEFTGAPAALTITTTSMPNAVVGVPYNVYQLLRSGGTAPFSWDNNGAGSSLNDADAQCGFQVSTSGAVTGTPSSTGECVWTARLTDATTSVTKQLSITVTDPPPPIGDGDASDPFTCASTCSLGPEWTPQTSALLSLAGDEAVSTGAQTTHFAYYAAEAFDPGQRSCVIISSLPTSTAWQYAGVRMSGTGSSLNGYFATAENGFTIVAKFIAGVRTPLTGLIPADWQEGNQLCLDIDGSNLIVRRNLQEVVTVDSQGQLSSGQPGFGIWGPATVTSWEGFNLDAVPDPPANESPIAAFVTPTTSAFYPPQGETYTATAIPVSGTCSDNDGTISAASLTVNGGSPLALDGTNTAWSRTVPLSVGLNVIVATCTDNAAAASTATLNVTRTSIPGKRRRVGRVR
jgi:hypothetical protein